MGAFRDAHLDGILDQYYADYSSYFDCELEPGLKTYTLQKFKEDFHWHKQIGFTTACSVMPNVLSDQELNIFTAPGSCSGNSKRSSRTQTIPPASRSGAG